MSGERRNLANQKPKPGGRRRGDPPNQEPPFTTRECADWMGVSTEYIREAINIGVWTSTGLVRLEAEYVPQGEDRGFYRVHVDAFVVFLKRIGWTRMPKERPAS
jgi:hypothetical protein